MLDELKNASQQRYVSPYYIALIMSTGPGSRGDRLQQKARRTTTVLILMKGTRFRSPAPNSEFIAIERSVGLDRNTTQRGRGSWERGRLACTHLISSLQTAACAPATAPLYVWSNEAVDHANAEIARAYKSRQPTPGTCPTACPKRHPEFLRKQCPDSRRQYATHHWMNS